MKWIVMSQHIEKNKNRSEYYSSGQAASPDSMSSSTLHGTNKAYGTDLLTFAFDSPCEVDEQKPIYIEAENPIWSLNKSQTRILVRRLIAGFLAAGLRKGDSVLVALANNVRERSF